MAPPKPPILYGIGGFFIVAFRQLSAERAKQKTTRYAGGEQKVIPKNHQSSYNKGVQAYCRKKGDSMAQKANSLAHTKWMCKYHIVFVPKYRRKVIYNQYRRSLQEIIRLLCKYKGVEIVEGHMMPDHIHLLLSIPPKLSVRSGELHGVSERKERANDV